MLTTVEKAVRAGVRTIAGTPGTLETTVAERTSTAEGRRQQQRLQPKRYSWVVNSSKKNSSGRHPSNSRDHYNSWDARLGNGSNNIGHSNVSGNSKGRRIIIRR